VRTQRGQTERKLRLTSASNVESTGAMTYGYDNNGNLTSKTDANSVTASTTCDALNRVTTKTYSDGTPQSLTATTATPPSMPRHRAIAPALQRARGPSVT
jgi:YD repeat-containing protein